MKDLFITLGISMLPISELRGAIPFGLKKGLPFPTVLIVSIIGNLLPCIPLYFFLERILNFLGRFKYGSKFNNWLIKRTKSKSEIIETYKTIGLLIFVGIPLPMTGAWTGTIASVILQLKFRSFLIGIIGGVILASIIVSILTFGIRSIPVLHF